MNKRQFLSTLRSERQRWEAELKGASDERLCQPGAIGEWSVKDIIAHLTAYENGLVKWLEAAADGKSLVFAVLDHRDVDYRNALIYEENRERSLGDVMLESKRVFQRLLKLVGELSEADLLEAERSEWFVKPRWHMSRPLWKCIADDSYEHYRQHIPGVRRWLSESTPDR
ncbi:MAG: ClbS/DfsB family four-helix bundle protein [Gemmatimonadota bacterium]|nr:MAG: ClbS/DfsB family four-helix bundle protein [Gemmatimonadota bacterium]